MSLRRRVLAYLAFAAIASCALTVGFGVVLLRHRIAAQQFAQLRATADTLAFTSGHPIAQQAGVHVYRVDTRHHHLARPAFTAAVVQAIGTTNDTQGTVQVGGHAFIYVSRHTATGRVILLRRATVRFAQFKPFLEALVLAGIGGRCWPCCCRSCSPGGSPVRFIRSRRPPAGSPTVRPG